MDSPDPSRPPDRECSATYFEYRSCKTEAEAEGEGEGK